MGEETKAGSGGGVRRRRPAMLLAAVVAVLAIGTAAAAALHQHRLYVRLLTTDPDRLEADPALVRYAEGLAAPAYRSHCAGCHGADAHGTAQGPSLEGNRRLRQRSTGQLRTLIQHGIPAAGMPAFDLPIQQLDALATGRVVEL